MPWFLLTRKDVGVMVSQSKTKKEGGFLEFVGDGVVGRSKASTVVRKVLEIYLAR